MRLIVDTSYLPNYGRDYQRRWSGFARPLRIIARLEDCAYPLGQGFADVLWMADEEERYGHLKGIMAKRFKRSTRDPDEFTQAAWTRAVFDQVDTLIWGCRQPPRPESGSSIGRRTPEATVAADQLIRLVRFVAEGERRMPYIGVGHLIRNFRCDDTIELNSLLDDAERRELITRYQASDSARGIVPAVRIEIGSPEIAAIISAETIEAILANREPNASA